MSKISDAIRESNQIHFLVELNFDEYIKRFSHQTLSVPFSGGEDKIFEGCILNDFSIGNSFDLTNLKYSIQNISITIANNMRFQDEEKRHYLENGTGKIYVWTEGLDWADVETNGLLFQGSFVRQNYNKFEYSFALISQIKEQFHIISGITINEDYWTNPRSGDMNKVIPLIFGNFLNVKVPLICYDSVNFKYAVCTKDPKTTDTDYNNAVCKVYTQGNTIIDLATYSFEWEMDDELNERWYFKFDSNQVSNEPLSCTIQGIIDIKGEITGTVDKFIQNPAYIYYYLLKYFSDIENINSASIKTMAAYLNGLQFSVLINSSISCFNVLERILFQCQCAQIERGLGLNIIYFDIQAQSTSNIQKEDLLGDSLMFNTTSDDLVTNNLKINYNFDPVNKKYSQEITKDSTNHPLCSRSKIQYGERVQKILNFPDVQEQYVVDLMATRYLEKYASRHNLINLSVSYVKGFDVLEGDVAELTFSEGSSLDGNGFVNERAILIERKFQRDRIDQTWWIINPI